MGVFNFDQEELEGIASNEAQARYIQKYGFVPPPLPAGYSHLEAPLHAPTPQRSANGAQANGVSRQTTPPPTPPPGSGQVNGFGHSNQSGEQVTTLVARKAPKNKKRVQPTFMGSLGATPGASSTYNVQSASSIPSANVPIAGQHDNANPSNINIKLPPPPLQSFAHPQPPISSSSAFARPAEPADSWMDVDSGFMPDSGMDMEVPISALDSRSKRRASEIADDSNKQVKARTLGGDRVREATSNNDVREIRSQSGATRNVSLASTSAVVLEAPALKTYLCCNADDSISPTSSTGADILEVRNSEDGSEFTESNGECPI
jgi:protein HIRA/HIR1